MSYDALLRWVSGKQPIYLYRIRLGDTIEYLTSRARDFLTVPDFFERDGFFDEPDFFYRTWKGSPTRHTQIRETGAEERAEVRLILSQNNTMAQNIAADEGFNETEVTIYRVFANDPDAGLAAVFVGRVSGTERKWIRYEVICENDFTAFQAKAQAQVIQRPCRHAHYHTGCNLRLADWQVDATATAFTGDTVTVTEAALQGNGYYSGGIIQFGPAMAMIRSHNGTQLLVLGNVPGLAAEIAANGSGDVKIAPGCNLASDCAGKFNNLLNFGGFEHLSENPFDGRRID